MKTSFHPNERRREAAWLLPVVTVLALLACLFGSGCSCFRKGKSSDRIAPQVKVLNGSFEALKREFNADTSKPRGLAIFSPTCGGCIYGAKALQNEAQKLPQVGDRAKVLIAGNVHRNRRYLENKLQVENSKTP